MSATPTDHPTTRLHGRYRDILRGPDGQLIEDRGWRPNTIVVDCRRLLAAFVRGGPALGVRGLALGAGLPAWDTTGSPAGDETRTSLFDSQQHVVPIGDLTVDYLDGNVVTAVPSNRLQIVAQIGPGVPGWPDGAHPTGALREFGLVAELGGTPVLINHVIHPVIHKDPVSTLERTIWLVF